MLVKGATGNILQANLQQYPRSLAQKRVLWFEDVCARTGITDRAKLLHLTVYVGCNYLSLPYIPTVYPKKYAHGFVVLCFVVVMQSFIMNSHEVFIHIHQGCFAGTGAIVRLPQCQWSKPDGYGKIGQRITQQSTAKQKPCAYLLGYTVPLTRKSYFDKTVLLQKYVSLANKYMILWV